MSTADLAQPVGKQDAIGILRRFGMHFLNQLRNSQIMRMSRHNSQLSRAKQNHDGETDWPSEVPCSQITLLPR